MNRAVQKHAKEKWMILYIERWLTAPMQEEDGQLVPRDKGTPQGGVVSPLLANLFLHYAFDLWMQRKYPHLRFERYADDVIVHCRTENREMKLRLSGRSGTGITYAYDAQGRVTEMRDRNPASDTVTTISYNEHGDKSEERTTIAGNATVQFGMAFAMDENGTVTPEERTVEESPDLPLENEVRHEYEYDSYGNWTQQTENHSYGSDIPSNVRHRKLTYY